MTVTTRCPHCEQPVIAGDRFCAHCGQTVTPGDAQATRGGSRAEAAAAAADARLIDDLREATVGDYDIHSEIGRGGMAVVYLAHDLQLNRKVAIKVLMPGLLLMQGMAARFKQEAQTAAQLAHTNIMPIHAVRETDRIVYFVMRFARGGPLHDIMNRIHAPMPVPMVLSILSDVGSALAHAHRHGVVHRDVKPANIMVEPEGSAIVTDFGIAKRADVEGMTLPGVVMGTPTYMSPEQWNTQPVTGASDQYSLGVMAFEMLAGTAPYTGPSAVTLMRHHCEAPVPDIQQVLPSVPPAIADAVTRMLQKDPRDRWSTIDEALSAMNAGPLGANDPIRAQLAELTTADTEILTQRPPATPRSPLLLTRDESGGLRPSQQPAPRGAPPPAAPLKVRTTPRPAQKKSRRGFGFVKTSVAVGTGFLTTAVLTIWVLTLLTGPDPVAVAPTGTLTVSGLPAAGTIFVNGRAEPGPLVTLDTGRHQVRLSAAGYGDHLAEIVVRPDGDTSLVFPMVPVDTTPPVDDLENEKAVLVVASEIEADLMLGSIDQGRIVVPKRFELSPGSYRVQLHRDGYVPIDTIVNVAGSQTRLDLKMQRLPTARWVIRVAGIDMSVFVDGQDLGRESTIDREFLPGIRRLLIQKAGVVYLETPVNLPEGGDTLLIGCNDDNRTCRIVRN